MESQKRHIYKSPAGLVALLACLSLLCCCVKEDTGKYRREGEVLIQFQMPVVRADGSNQIYTYEHEEFIEHLHVLVFGNSGGNFIEVLEAEEQTALSADDNPVFSFRVNPGTYDFMFLANSGDVIAANLSSMIKDVTTRAEVIEMLTLELTSTSGKWITDTSDPQYIPMPMWGEKRGATISAPGADWTGQSDLVPMIRMMARIDVKIGPDPQSKNYKLYSVRLYNRRKEGQLIPNENQTSFWRDPTEGWQFEVYNPSIPTGNKVQGPLHYETDESTTELQDYMAKIYTFETELKDNLADDMLNYTSLVLGIGKQKKPGGATRGGTDPGGDPGGGMLGGDPWSSLDIFFYRVDFINGGNFLPILRNYNYEVTVDRIVNEGFPDPDKAYRSQRYDFDYTIQQWQGHNDDVEIPGTYRLDISKTFLDIEHGGNKEGKVTISTSHPDGWSAYISSYPDRIELDPDPAWKINALYAVDGGTSYVNTGNVDNEIVNLPPEKTFTLTVQTEYHDGNISPYAYGYVHIVAGNLTNVITVRKAGSRWE